MKQKNIRKIAEEAANSLQGKYRLQFEDDYSEETIEKCLKLLNRCGFIITKKKLKK